MKSNLLDISEKLRSCNKIDPYWQIVVEELKQFGLTGLLYAATGSAREIEIKGANSALWVKTDYTQDFFDTFGNDTYLDNDPAVDHALKSITPMMWHHDQDFDAMTREEKDAWFIADEIGFHVGFTLSSQAFSPNHIGGCGVCMGNLTPEEFDRMWRDHHSYIVQVLGLLNIGMRQQHIKELIRLAPREKEVLEWLAVGLRPDQIADRLSIGYRTVDKYIASAKVRLKAATRDQAVAKAIMFNAIDI